MDLDELLNSKEKSANVRPDEITGHQHAFHSLPKEFQAWHNTQYITEKKTTIDESTVPDSLLNAYMWKSIYDASKFAIPTVIGIFFSVIKLKLSPNFLGILAGLTFYLPWLLYTAYHFFFYAKIKAQVVGPVTKKSAKYTADTYYSTFYGVIISLIVAGLYTFYALKDIAYSLYNFILNMDTKPGLINDLSKDYSIKLYNLLVDLLEKPKNATWSEALMSNIYVTTITYTLFTVLFLFLVERAIYKNRREIVDKEIEQEELQRGFALDTAMLKADKWRKENGV